MKRRDSGGSSFAQGADGTRGEVVGRVGACPALLLLWGPRGSPPRTAEEEGQDTLLRSLPCKAGEEQTAAPAWGLPPQVLPPTASPDVTPSPRAGARLKVTLQTAARAAFPRGKLAVLLENQTPL